MRLRSSVWEAVSAILLGRRRTMCQAEQHHICGYSTSCHSIQLLQPCTAWPSIVTVSCCCSFVADGGFERVKILAPGAEEEADGSGDAAAKQEAKPEEQ